MEKLRFGINGDWKGITVAICFMIVFLFVPIFLNESVGFDQISAFLSGSDGQPSVNPYYADNNKGEVAGISTTANGTSAQKFVSIPVLGKIEVNQENLLIFSIASLSIIVFAIVYLILTLVENKRKPDGIIETGFDLNTAPSL